MTRHSVTRTISVACMLLAFGALARADDIVHCAQQAGPRLHTDVPCAGEAAAAPARAVTEASAVGARVSWQGGPFATEGQVRETAWAKNRPANRRPAPDAMTVQAARSSLQLMDQGSTYPRRQKFAALDLRGEHWFDFR